MDKELQNKIIGEKDINDIVKAGKLGGIYFIFGDENYLKLYYANQIAQRTVGDSFADFNLHRLDGTTISIEAIRDAAESLPMFSEMSCVIVHDLPINSMKKNDLENLKLILNNISATCSFVLLMDTVEKKNGKNGNENKINNKNENKFENINNDETKSDEPDSAENNTEMKIDAWDEILSIAILNGYAIKLNKRSSWQLTPLLIKKASEKGCKLDEQSAGYLIESVGNDISNLQNELEKICRYVKEKTITLKDIDSVAAKSVETRAYNMADRLIENKNDEAYSILQTLLSQKVEPLIIMGSLISPFIDMYRVKIAQLSGQQPENIAKHFNYGENMFRLTKKSAFVKKKSISQLSQCLEFLDEADTFLKTSSIDKKLVIEQTMAKISNALNNSTNNNFQ